MAGQVGRPVAAHQDQLGAAAGQGGVEGRDQVGGLLDHAGRDLRGGGIFSFLPQAELPGDLFEPLFGTPHGLDLMALAAAARVPARVVEKAADLVPALDAALAGGGTELVLVRSDRAANLARHRALAEAVAVAVSG